MLREHYIKKNEEIFENGDSLESLLLQTIFMFLKLKTEKNKSKQIEQVFIILFPSLIEKNIKIFKNRCKNASYQVMQENDLITIAFEVTQKCVNKFDYSQMDVTRFYWYINSSLNRAFTRLKEKEDKNINRVVTTKTKESEEDFLLFVENTNFSTDDDFEIAADLLKILSVEEKRMLKFKILGFKNKEIPNFKNSTLVSLQEIIKNYLK